MSMGRVREILGRVASDRGFGNERSAEYLGERAPRDARG